MLGNVQPNRLVVERVLVGVEALECVLVSGVVAAVHGGVVLVTEHNA